MQRRVDSGVLFIWGIDDYRTNLKFKEEN
jgi:hypothetical protein